MKSTIFVIGTIWIGLLVKEKMMPSDVPLRLQENNPKSVYMSQYAPHLKEVREQIAFEIQTCTQNIQKLSKLMDNFDTEHSKVAVRNKIEEVKIQRGYLRGTLYKIDAEAEKGMLIKQCNYIEHGEMRYHEMETLLNESQTALDSVRQINNNNSRVLHTLPPRVIRVVEK